MLFPNLALSAHGERKKKEWTLDVSGAQTPCRTDGVFTEFSAELKLDALVTAEEYNGFYRP